MFTIRGWGGGLRFTFFRQNIRNIQHALNFFLLNLFFCNVNFWSSCFCSQDYHRKGVHIIFNIILNKSVGEVYHNQFFFSKSKSVHSSSIGICIKKGEKSTYFCTLQGLRGRGGQSLGDMFSNKSSFFLHSPLVD